jgi:hypothetical protein
MTMTRCEVHYQITCETQSEYRRHAAVRRYKQFASLESSILMKRPSDFSETTIEVLAKRVGYLCSRASCRCPTVGPHSNESKATLVGEAAHICAASPGGPRYDPSMTDKDRRSPDNGIWLCAKCATEIDKDSARFPVSLLRRWKADAEDEALKLLENPSYRRLGIPKPAFAPPLDYQLRALEQVIAHLRNSGVKKVSLPQLGKILHSPLLRDGINPIFEPLSVETIVDALDELIRTGKLGVEDRLLILVE